MKLYSLAGSRKTLHHKDIVIGQNDDPEALIARDLSRLSNDFANLETARGEPVTKMTKIIHALIAKGIVLHHTNPVSLQAEARAEQMPDIGLHEVFCDLIDHYSNV